MSLIWHEIDERTGELLLRAQPPRKAVPIAWIRGVHFELGRMLEQLELLETPAQSLNGYNARCTFVTAARMLISDLYVALRHAELEQNPLTALKRVDTELQLPCAREGCGHAFAEHQSPGAECTALIGGVGDFCPCARFQSVMPAPKGG